MSLRNDKAFKQINDKQPIDNSYQIFNSELPTSTPLNNQKDELSTDEFVENLVIPLPVDNMGVVYGKLLNSELKPFLNVIFLGRAIEANQEGKPPLIVFDPNDAKKAIQNKDGLFVFDLVVPGKYGLIMWNPITEVLMQDLQGSDIIIEVHPGETLNLETIIVQ